MKKFMLSLAFVAISIFASAQQLSFDNPIERENGVRLELAGLEDGKLIKYTQLDLEGNLVQEGTYLDGKPHGVWTMYLPNGNTSTMKFDRGRRIVMVTEIEGRKVEIFYKNNRPTKSIAYFK